MTENAAEGFAQRKDLPRGAMLVSRAGHVFTRHSIRFHAPQSELHGVLARQREIEQLQADLDAKQASLAQRQTVMAQAESVLAQQQKDIARLRSATGEAQQKQHRLQLEVQRLVQVRQQAEQRQKGIAAEQAEIAEQLESESEQLAAAEASLKQGRSQIEALREQLDETRQERSGVEQNLNRQREALRQTERAAQEAVFVEKNCLNKIGELEVSSAQLAEQAREAVIQLENLLAEQQGIQRGTVEPGVAAGTNPAAGEGEGFGDGARCLGRGGEQPARAGTAAHEQRAEAAAAARPDQRAAPQGAGSAPWPGTVRGPAQGQPVPMRRNWCKRWRKISGPMPCRQRSSDSRRKSKRSAQSTWPRWKSCKSAGSASGYLESQANDLNEAIDTLEQAIRRIDRETRERLQKHLRCRSTAISANFSRRCLAAARRRLMLTGEELLDAGIQIIAQPPGKKNSSIHLLSGGEKALTALALTFSLFQLNPAPFCLLDEVDAPLDDSNTERFCELVKKMSVQTQFVYHQP